MFEAMSLSPFLGVEARRVGPETNRGPVMTNQLHDLLAQKAILSEKRAAELAGLSLVTFRRLRKGNAGPRWVRLSQRRVGYQAADFMQWLDSRRSSDATA
jgi:predicted DNA-binding transcriptional regulator AlpA